MEYLVYARLYVMYLTFTDKLILLMILQSKFYYLLYLTENETEKQRFRNML